MLKLLSQEELHSALQEYKDMPPKELSKHIDSAMTCYKDKKVLTQKELQKFLDELGVPSLTIKTDKLYWATSNTSITWTFLTPDQLRLTILDMMFQHYEKVATELGILIHETLR